MRRWPSGSHHPSNQTGPGHRQFSPGPVWEGWTCVTFRSPAALDKPLFSFGAKERAPNLIRLANFIWNVACRARRGQGNFAGNKHACCAKKRHYVITSHGRLVNKKSNNKQRTDGNTVAARRSGVSSGYTTLSPIHKGILSSRSRACNRHLAPLTSSVKQ